jgi:hypothetical protein
VRCPLIELTSVFTIDEVTLESGDLYHHYVRSWHIQVIKTAYEIHDGLDLHLESPRTSVVRILPAEFPLRMNRFPIEDYNKTSLGSPPYLDEWFRTEWIPWVDEQPMFSDSQGTSMNRLVEGVFRFGGSFVMLSLKLNIAFDLVHGTAILTRLIVMDGFARMG